MMKEREWPQVAFVGKPYRKSTSAAEKEVTVSLFMIGTNTIRSADD
jgi:hypothetical protein